MIKPRDCETGFGGSHQDSETIFCHRSGNDIQNEGIEKFNFTALEVSGSFQEIR